MTQLHERTCPLLDAEAPTDALPYAPPPWDLRQCRETGFVFLRNAPTYERLTEEFAWESTYRNESKARSQAEPIRYAISTFIKSLRSRLKRNKVVDLTVESVLAVPSREAVRLLDVGCGWGQLLGEVLERLPAQRRRACRPMGIEISTELARLSQEALAPLGGACLHASALEGLTRCDPDSLDVVVMASFLEHEVQPLDVLRQCAVKLAPGGRVIVKVPNYASWNRSLRGARWCGFRWPDHVNYFTPDTLRAIAIKAGLHVQRLDWSDRFPLSDSLYAVLERPVRHRA
jgi:2-polyprenyl-3-methyl-5-hydroxy-6-metoxy-1,4-benzoquinol methylase